jgi:hypothetical protein
VSPVKVKTPSIIASKGIIAITHGLPIEWLVVPTRESQRLSMASRSVGHEISDRNELVRANRPRPLRRGGLYRSDLPAADVFFGWQWSWRHKICPVFYQHIALHCAFGYPKSVRRGMKDQNYSQKLWQQYVAASELDPPKLLDIAIPYEEVSDTAREIAAQTRERIRKIACTDSSNTGCIDEI